MTRILKAGLLFLSLFIAGIQVQAKDLTNRLGIGYADPFSVDMPGLQARYWPSARYGFSATLGLDTEEDAARFGLFGKMYKVIFTEENMNFYMGTGAGIFSREEANSAGTVDSDTGFELSAFCGVEFFFPGLDSLSFTFEAGAGVASIDSEVRFRTIGDSPLTAGMLFYF